jgi:hypothetical protein
MQKSMFCLTVFFLTNPLQASEAIPPGRITNFFKSSEAIEKILNPQNLWSIAARQSS